ncbi:MAG: hypothetical protein HYV07_00015 [Deltaproteobacteria bacterium]|nr:hypothetical protein [Deltaproteobacteria bacterium]
MLILALGSYAYFEQGGGWNQNTRFDLTRALVERREASIDAYHSNTGDKAQKDGHYYADKAPGVSVLGAPVFGLVRALSFASESPSGEQLRTAAWVVTLASVGVPSAVAAAALPTVLGAAGVPMSWATLLSVGYAIGTPAFAYSTLLYGHQLAAALLLLALALAQKCNSSADPRRAAGVGALLGAAVTVEYPCALLGLPIAVYAIREQRARDARIAWGLLGALPPLAALAAYHTVIFGGPLTTPYAFSTQPHRAMGLVMGLGFPTSEAIHELSIGPYRGLLRAAPWLALGVFGAFRGLRRTGTRALTTLSITVAGTAFVLAASLVDWPGGWGVAPRHLVPAIPFVVILGAMGIEELGRRPATLVIALVLFSIIANLALTSVNPEVELGVTQPWSEVIWPGFSSGRLAQSTQSIVDHLPRPYGPAAASNFGQALGLEGLLSLAPLLSFWCACAFFLRRGFDGARRGV